MARKRVFSLLAAALALIAVSAVAVAQASSSGHSRPSVPQPAQRLSGRGRRRETSTATPIKHLVVIFDENISFDHYFGTYPYATNPSGSRRSTPLRGRRR